MNIEDHIEWIATYLALSIPGNQRALFDEIEPFTLDFGDTLTQEGISGGTDEERSALLPPSREITLLDLKDRLDVCEIADDGTPGVPHGSVAVSRIRVVSPSEYRGAAPFRKHVARIDAAFVDGLGNFAVSRSGYVGSHNGRQWEHITTGSRLWPAEGRDKVTETINCSSMIQYLRQREWRVVLGYEQSPGLSLSISPSGAQEVFRLRDIPNGRERRMALRHWVRTYWRKVPGSGEAAEVRAHLRGATNFVWNGLRCSIRVPPEQMDHYTPGPATSPDTK